MNRTVIWMSGRQLGILRGECMYLFEKPLIRGTLLKRKSQFTALIDIDGEELIAHIPTTNRIGDVENKNLPCLKITISHFRG